MHKQAARVWRLVVKTQSQVYILRERILNIVASCKNRQVKRSSHFFSNKRKSCDFLVKTCRVKRGKAIVACCCRIKVDGCCLVGWLKVENLDAFGARNEKLILNKQKFFIGVIKNLNNILIACFVFGEQQFWNLQSGVFAIVFLQVGVNRKFFFLFT